MSYIRQVDGFQGLQVAFCFRPQVEEQVQDAQAGDKSMPGFKYLCIMRVCPGPGTGFAGHHVAPVPGISRGMFKFFSHPDLAAGVQDFQKCFQQPGIQVCQEIEPPFVKRSQEILVKKKKRRIIVRRFN